MKGRLKKIGNEYKLYAQDDSCIATSWHSPYQRLSKKNCEAIENGYDLDEIRKLADEDFESELGDGPTNNESINSMLKKSNANGAEWGFQKAIEILSDKKFSESNLRIGCSSLLNLEKEEGELSEVFTEKQYRHIDTYIQSLQQTEWDVEIVTEKFFKVEGDNGITIYAEAMEEFDERNDYKLDKDGCLILKRK